MHDKATAPVKKAAQIVKRPANVEIRYIHMPMLMRQKRLLKACSLFARLFVPSIQKPCPRKNPPGARRAYRNYIAVEHHKSKPSISFQRIIHTELYNGLSLPLFQPKITGNRRIMFVNLSVPIYPCIKLALADLKPLDKAIEGNIGLLIPVQGEINYGVACIMGNPDAG
jgi:hypothetical protein